MNGTSGFQEVRSSTPITTAYRFLHEQRHQFGTETWHRYLAIQVLSFLLLWLPCLSSSSQAQVPPPPPITSSGLNTQVNLSATPPPGGVQYDITGGTRPGDGANLFHSFSEFGVPTNNIANFLNGVSFDLAGNPLAPGLPTSNILGRVTSGNISNIFGMIQTTGFENANLFLMNPTGFLFGPNATVNVGGMVAFTSADYLKLTDNARFNAIPNAAADALLTALPVAAFGFLGSNPGAITVQGSQFTVTEGTGISLVGGNVTIEAGTPDGGAVQPALLSAPAGRINFASAASPGEFLAGTLEQAPNSNGQSFGALGTIQISQQSLIDVSGNGGGNVLIRGGQFVMDNSTISANITGPGPITNGVESIGGGIDIQVSQDAVIQNLAVIETNVVGNATPDVQYGGVHVEAEHIEIAGVLDFELFPFTGIRSNILPGSMGGNSGTINLGANSILGKDIGQIETFNEGAGDAGNIRMTATRDIDLNTVLIQSSSVDAAGNAGDIDLISTSGNISMTTFTLVTSQASFSNGHAGAITVSAPLGDILLADQVTVFNQAFNAGPIGGIEFTAKNLQLNAGSFISGDNLTALTAGNISVTLSDSLSLDGDSGITTVARGPAAAADLTIRAHDVSIADNSFLTTETFVSGPGGRLNIATENLQLTSGGQLRSGSVIEMDEFGPTIPSGAGGTITIQGLTGQTESIVIDGPGSGIFTDTQGTGAGGNIFMNANSVTIENGGTLSATTSGTETTATGGTIAVHANQIQLNNQARITADSSGAGNAGTVTMTAEENIVLLDNSSILTAANGEGNGGLVSLTAPSIELHGNSNIVTFTVGFGDAGDIELQGNQVNLTESFVTAGTQAEGRGGNITIRGLTGEGSRATDVRLSDNSQLVSETQDDGEHIQGAAGNILVETARLNVSGASLVNTASRGSTGAAGNITVNATDSLTISGFGTQLFSGSTDQSLGDAGHISISAPSVVVENSGSILTSTSFVGNAGTITVSMNNLQLLSGGHITSSSLVEFPELPTSGAAGTVTIQGLASPAQSVLINGLGSGLFTETQGSGAGGNIFVNANSATLANGATLSASSTGQIENPGDAGTIDITATNGFTMMQNSTITTQAGQGAGGGDIKVTTSPEATVLLQNSLISASVADGDGGGGNISIDPQYVILQNSQILAQAAQGQGGAITIIANLFLPDATSIVNADSGSGLHGTVTIQSPNAPASGKIQPLGKTPLQATTLLNQRCAALAGGEFSSFTVAGRDSLPTEPSSWLTSPLYAAGAGEGMGMGGARLETMTLGASLASETAWLSLRQIAPAGFLTQAFALDWSTGCQS